MVSATLYKFSKKGNSTARPNQGTPSLPISIIINDGASSILSPSVRVPTNQTGVPTGTRVFDYNYIYIPDFRRYYYVSNWVYNADGTWTAICTIDVLASWKNEIIASPGYVGRSTNHFDEYIQDNFYISRNTPVTIRDNADTGCLPAANTGTFVLGVNSAKNPTTGTGNGNLGSVSYYMLDITQFATLIRNLLGIYDANDNVYTPTWKIKANGNFESDAWKSVNTPLQYLSSCRFYPWNFNRHTSNVEQIVFGGWAVGGNGGHKMIRLYDESQWRSIQISNVNQVGDYNPEDYPTYEPYANYILQTPWGEFPLDGNIMSNILKRDDPRLYWKIMINYPTGTGTFVVTDSAAGTFPENSARTTTHELIRTEIKCATDIALQDIVMDETYGINAGISVFKNLHGVFGGIFQGITGIMSGNVSGAGSGFQSSLNSAVDSASSLLDAMRGGQRTAMGTTYTDTNCTPLISQISVQQTRYSTVGRSPEMFGKPLKRPVSNLSSYQGTPFTGFIQMDYSEFHADCTDEERNDVIALLNGGILLE